MSGTRFWLSDEQWNEIRDVLRLDIDARSPRVVADRITISGIVQVLRSGCAWRNSPPEYGPSLTLIGRYRQLKQDGGLQKIAAVIGGIPAVDGEDAALAKIARSAALENDLPEAVASFAFEIRYRPRISVRTNRVVAFEALLSWHHPTLGEIAPADFIPLAEQMGLITTLGKEMLNRACAQAATWPEDVGLALHASTLQLRDKTFPSSVAVALHSARLEHSRLELQITESHVLTDFGSDTLGVLHELNALGIPIAIADLSCRYSSMSSLMEVPYNAIKIDQSFVRQLDAEGGANPTAIAIVESLIALCAKLGIVCTAEGVETAGQLSALRERGCARAQGDLIGKPALPSDCLSLLQSRNPAVDISTPLPVELPFSKIIESANDIILVTTPDLDPPGPRIVYVNPAFEQLTGFQASEVIGLSPRILQGPRTDRVILDRIREQLGSGNEVSAKVLNFTKSGAPYWLDLRIVPIRNEHGEITHFASVQRDITLDRRRVDELVRSADRDVLTGIPNRRALLRTIREDIRRSNESGAATDYCMAIIDVDHFKHVNDTFGHATGDAVLLGLADRLVSHSRRTDTIGRLGGEEFVVWMSFGAALQDCSQLAERFRRAVAAAPFETLSGPLAITVSIGVAAFKRGDTLEGLMRQADDALYAAKRAGRNRVEP